MIYKNDTIEKLIEVISNCENIVIAGHINPDPDSIGACLGLAISLNKLGKKINVLLESYNKKYQIIPGKSHIYVGDYSLLNPDLFISVDCGSRERLGKSLNLFLKSKYTIVIDHHISNNYFGRYNYINHLSSSTCELIFDIIQKIGNIDKDIAECLYIGILIDTGGFRHKNTSSKTLNIVGYLMDFGINFSYIYNQVMLIKTIEDINIYKLALDKLCIDKKMPICYTTITIDDMKKVNANHNNLDGIVESILNIEGIDIGIFIYEKDENMSKISLRSHEFDVNKIANCFGGGGHKNAAGFVLNENVYKALEITLNIFRKEF